MTEYIFIGDFIDIIYFSIKVYDHEFKRKPSKIMVSENKLQRILKDFRVPKFYCEDIEIESKVCPDRYTSEIHEDTIYFYEHLDRSYRSYHLDENTGGDTAELIQDYFLE